MDHDSKLEYLHSSIIAQKLGVSEEKVIGLIEYWWEISDKLFGDDPEMYFFKEVVLDEGGKPKVVGYYANWYGYEIIQSPGFNFIG